MKKLNKMVLGKAKIMTAPQMKHISGGGWEGECDGVVCDSWYCEYDSVNLCMELYRNEHSGVSPYQCTCLD